MQKSFTLIELLIIIGIIGILVLIGIPAFRVYQPTMQLSSATRELIVDLRYTGQLAVLEQIEHSIHFVTMTNEYQIIRHSPVEQILKTKGLPGKVRFKTIVGLTNNRVIFNSFGAVRETGTVTLINTKNATRIIDIRPSGFIRTK